METFVSLTQQMLDGDLTMDEAAEEIMQIEPAEPKYDIDGMYYEDSEDNTVNAMLALGMDKRTRKMNPQIEQQIEDLIDAVEEKEESEY